MNVLDAGSAFENIARVMRTPPTILRFGTSSAFRALPLRLCVIGCLATAPACQRDAAPEPSPERSATEQPASQHTASTLSSAKNPGSTIESTAQKNAAQKNAAATGTAPTVRATAGDPVKGKFTLEDATKGLPGTGPLQATIDTDLGTLKCDLFEDKAPITVANFVGLARGTRPWKQDGKWVTKPLYDGTVFHRVVRGFMIQGGDPNGNGTGGPGYEIPDEIWPGAKHDERGLLCMANRGKDTNGSQFFVMDGKASHLDGGYTIFGKCGPDAVIDKLSSVKVQGQTAVNPTQIKTVTIARKQ